MSPSSFPLRGLLASLLLLGADVPALAAEAPRLVSVVRVENRPLSPKIMVIGSVHSRNSAELTAGVDGRLEWVAEAGTRVQAGETVARLDQSRLRLQQAEQEALIERESITLVRLERDYRRLQQLLASKNASQTELDKAETDRDMAAANLKLAQIQLKIIEDDLGRTRIKAPFGGIVTARQHQAGEDIGRAEAVLAMTDPEQLEIRLHAPLKHSRRVKVGDSLQIYHSKGEFEARIRSLIPVSDVRSQTFEARIDLPLEIQDGFSVGELVSLALPIAPKQLTTLVPRDAIVLRSSGAFVFKIDEDAKALKVPVTLGNGAGDWIAVQGALTEADSVVVRGAETLQDGQQVQLQAPAVAASSAG
ncbi:efflux RND transporter periplasmic adaptor subunit [Shewanella sp. AS16]|uniref:efflux RND transporter periplasmic adaptor subunit n=1 Tax=Shewanella sp. AS16 TaxID=2907625 RepID=UPI001F2E41C6|nr:efflux RND transporter periplasmic adaptor subunit [Shewanella sp. AS16]MCE9687865.1 efflux RND transporter periplasmic adaptor subunit [Shewanella sp. AS16]